MCVCVVSGLAPKGKSGKLELKDKRRQGNVCVRLRSLALSKRELLKARTVCVCMERCSCYKKTAKELCVYACVR